MYDTLLHMKALNNTPYMIGTSHGGLRNFGFETSRTPPELELLMEDLESLGLKLLEYPPPHYKNFSWGLGKFGFEAS